MAFLLDDCTMVADGDRPAFKAVVETTMASCMGADTVTSGTGWSGMGFTGDDMGGSLRGCRRMPTLTWIPR